MMKQNNSGGARAVAAVATAILISHVPMPAQAIQEQRAAVTLPHTRQTQRLAPTHMQVGTSKFSGPEHIMQPPHMQKYNGHTNNQSSADVPNGGAQRYSMRSGGHNQQGYDWRMPRRKILELATDERRAFESGMPDMRAVDDYGIPRLGAAPVELLAEPQPAGEFERLLDLERSTRPPFIPEELTDLLTLPGMITELKAQMEATV